MEAMKTTLADYLVRERAEIFQHQETMEKLSSLFGELKGIFEAIDIEKSNEEEDEVAVSTQKTNAEPSPKVEDTLAAATAAARSRRPSQRTEAATAATAAGDNQSLAPVFTSFLSRGYPQPPQPEVTASRDELLSPTTHNRRPPPPAAARDVVVTNRRHDLLDDLFDGHHSQQQQFPSTNNSSTVHHHRRPTVTFQGPPVNRVKADAYRRELLQQIEEKKQAKQAEIDRKRAADDELEKRINEQRLTMYLQYLEERQKGDFVGGKSNRTTAAADVLTAPRTSEEGTTQQQQHQNQPLLQHMSTDFSRLQLPTAAPQPDRNILSNLGEVRKIMQHDHIEMLQQLLDLHIK